MSIKMSSWNCNRGLVDRDGWPTDKLAEIDHFLQANKVHVLEVSEVALHGPHARTQRAHPLSELQIRQALSIPGYSIILPATWTQHHTARIMVYVSSEVQAKVVNTAVALSELPTITLEVRMVRESPTLVSYCYREYTGGVSGIKSEGSQLERLSRLTGHWSLLDQLGKDLVIMGDINLYYSKWLQTTTTSKIL